jgi:DNA modification methylase
MGDLITILNGDAREELKTLPDESVQICVTSPPYWGLRDYGIEPSVWGDDTDCPHEWGDRLPAHHPGQVKDNKAVHVENATGQNLGSGQYCQKCEAWLGCLGLEPTPEMYIAHLVEIFRGVRRVLRNDGTLWLNLGDSYMANRGNTAEKPGYDNKAGGNGANFYYPGKKNIPGYKPKDLLMIPHRTAIALQQDGWYVRMDNVWSKPNPMPESVTDRPTRSHEYVFLLSKSSRYFYDAEAIKEPIKENSLERLGRGVSDRHKNINGAPGQSPHTLSQPRLNVKFGGNKAEGYGTRIHSGNDWKPKTNGANKRSVWTVATHSYNGAHFATFPPDLIKPCILAGTSAHGCCVECGAPYERVLEPTEDYAKLLGKDWCDPESDQNEGRGHFLLPDGQKASQRPVKRNAPSVTAEYVTVGWQATCDCFYGPAFGDVEPCTVLDPFGGSGTTGKVAIELRRKAILIELNSNYIPLIEKRCSTQIGLGL